MNLLKSCFRFYINASIHVGMAVVSLSVFTYIQFDVSIDYKLLSFIFLSSISGYNFVKYAPIARLHHRSLTQRLKHIQIFSLIVFIGLLINLFFINVNVILICSGLGLMTLFYAIPVGSKNLREIAFLKVFVIAFIWAATSFILPFIEVNYDLNSLTFSWYFNFFERLFWVVLLMIPFEIRDLKYDKIYLKTIVSILGVQPTKIIAVTTLVVLSFVKYIYLDFTEFGLFLCIYLSLSFVILNSDENQKPYYASFWVEALPIFWVILSAFI